MDNSELKRRFYAAFQKFELDDEFKYINKLKKGGLINKKKDAIHIKDKNKGKFTASAKASGESVQEHAKSVLANSNATTLQKKRALFAVNAKKWKHLNGGIILKFQEAGVVLPPELAGMNYANAKLYWEKLEGVDPKMRAGIMGNMYAESKMNPDALNANYIGLTQMSKKLLYPWVTSTYGKGADGEIAYLKDYINGKLNTPKYRGSYGYGSSAYIAEHKGDYTPRDSARLFQKYYERNGMRGASARQAAAEAIYKLFNTETPATVEAPTPKPLSELPKFPIIELPDATTITKPLLPIQLRR